MADDALTPIVRRVSERYGHRLVEPRLLRSGANHVYAVADIVVRLAQSEVDVAGQVAIAKFLRESGVSIPRPIGSGEISGHRYSVWERIKPDASLNLDFDDFGGGIRNLHQIDVAEFAEFDLPWCDAPDWLDIDQNLTLARAVKVVDERDIDLLETHAERLRSWGEQCRATDRQVVCHGDVHPQNVLMSDQRAIILDWDTICLGPPQWDHAAMLTWPERWGGRFNDYDNFAAGYGESFEADPLAKELAEIRLLAPTINMITKGADNSRCALEAQRRMKFWRNEPDAPVWSPQ